MEVLAWNDVCLILVGQCDGSRDFFDAVSLLKSNLGRVVEIISKGESNSGIKRFQVYLSLHAISPFEFGMLCGESILNLKMSEIMEWFDGIDRIDGMFSKPVEFFYSSTNAVFLRRLLDLKELEKIKMKFPVISVDTERIAKSMIGWIFESQSKSIIESIVSFCEEYSKCEEDIMKTCKKIIEETSQRNSLFGYVNTAGLLEKSILLSHYFLSGLYFDLLMKYDPIPDFQDMFRASFPSVKPKLFPLKSRGVLFGESGYDLGVTEYGKDTAFSEEIPYGVYCFNLDGDFYVTVYEDIYGNRRVVLVDGGRSRVDSLEIMLSFVQRLDKIDLWVLTHRDEDHVGGFFMYMKGYIDQIKHTKKTKLYDFKFPKVSNILYRRHFLDEKNKVEEKSRGSKKFDYYRERYRYLSVASIFQELENIPSIGIKVLDPDQNGTECAKVLEMMGIELLPMEKIQESRKVWEKFGGITGENFFSLSVIIKHRDSKSGDEKHCLFTGDLKEETIFESVKSRKFFFGDLPMHGSKSCCSVDKFMSLDIKHFVCSRNKKNPGSKILDCLTKKRGFGFLQGLGRKIVIDETSEDFERIICEEGDESVLYIKF